MVGSAARLHILLALLGLSLYLIGFSQQMRLAQTPTEFDLDALSYPVEIGGRLAGDAEQLRFMAEGNKVGEQVLLVEADGARHSLRMTHRYGANYLWITGLSALFFWVMATLAFAPRILRPGARYFFWATLLYGMGVAIGGIYFRGDRDWTWSLIGHAHLAILAVLPVVFVHLSGSFPRRLFAANSLTWLPKALFILAVLLVLWESVTYEGYFRNPNPITGGRLVMPQRVADLILVGEVLLGIFFLNMQGRHAKLPRERRQVRWLVWGFVIGVTPYVFLRTFPSALGLPALLPAQADRILEFAIPIAMLMAVVRDQFLDIDVVLRRSLIYGSLAAILLLGTLAVGLIIRPLPPAVKGWPESVTWVLAGLTAGYLYRPLRRSLGYWADRRVFRLLQARVKLLEQVDQEVGAADSYPEVLAVLESRLKGALHPRRIEVFAGPSGEQRGSGRLSNEELDGFLEGWERLTGHPLDLVADRGSTEWPAIEREDFPLAMRSRGFVLAAPLRSEAKTVGLILLGPRETERHYVAKELEVLRRCARRASARMERLDLIRLAMEEETERRRLGELHRSKSEFLSRVAHDLRTPLTSISWSAQNLRDGVMGELQEGQRNYVDSIHQSCDYLNRLVQNLLDMSRLERGSLEFHCEMGEVESIVQRVCKSLEPVGAKRSVRIDVAAPVHSTPAWRDTERLEEALVNLLENAVKYSPPETTVEVALLVEPDELSITIRDHGPGIPEESGDILFDRFEQGPPSPWDSHEGFGLGLHIARSYVEGMAGSLSATNHADGGAIFRCSLLASPPNQEMAQ